MSETFNYPRTAWRLLPTAFYDGPTNMAIDEMLLNAVAAGESAPVLRFYGWKPGCVSLGYAQKGNLIDYEACAAKGWDVTRRATGGRAILHIDELTYMICASQDDLRMQGGILQSYRRLSEALLTGLKLLGLTPAEAVPQGAGVSGSGPVCFDGPANYEITLGDKKLIGSAQVRKKGVVLQHGTLPLFGDITRLLDVLGEQDGAGRAALRRKATTLEAGVGKALSVAETAVYMEQGFARTLNLALQTIPLTPLEEANVAQLRAAKYGNTAWIQERVRS